MTPSRGMRIAVGLFAVGATGIAAGLGLIGTLLDVDLPLVDPSPLILMAPVVVVPGFAGAVLGWRAAVAAITAGAVVSPIGAIFAIDGSCASNMFAGIGLVTFALYALVIAGLAAFAGDRIGASTGSSAIAWARCGCWSSSGRSAWSGGSRPWRCSSSAPKYPGRTC